MSNIYGVLVTHNEENMVYYAVKSILKAADKIIIVENGSSDNTINKLRLIKAEAPGRIIIYNLPWYGFNLSYYRNCCFNILKEQLNLVSNDWIFYIDSDDIYEDNIINLKDYLSKANPNKKILATKYYPVLDIDGETHIRDRISWMPRFFRWSGSLVWKGGYGNDLLYGCDPDYPQFSFYDDQHWGETDYEIESDNPKSYAPFYRLHCDYLKSKNYRLYKSWFLDSHRWPQKPQVLQQVERFFIEDLYLSKNYIYDHPSHHVTLKFEEKCYLWSHFLDKLPSAYLEYLQDRKVGLEN